MRSARIQAWGYLTPLEFKTTQQISRPDGGHAQAVPARAGGNEDVDQPTLTASLQ
jgi:hypothetical protein